METFIRDANGHWIYRHDTDCRDRSRDTAECGNQTQELMELQEAHGNTAPGECMVENMELIFEGAPARRVNFLNAIADCQAENVATTMCV